MINPLSAYILGAMLAWSPLKEHAPDPEPVTLARYEAIAGDVDEVVEDPAEAPLFVGDATKARTALQVAALSFFEGRFWSHVDEGECNRRSWRLAHPKKAMECDGGNAFSLWQIHPQFRNGKGENVQGIALEDGGGWHYDAFGITGRDMIYNRKLAVRVALHFARKSLAHGGTLCGYTGELTKTCPKAKARMDLALTYLRAHPFKPDADASPAVASR